MKKKIIIVGGARPNFIKISAILKAFKKHRRHFEVLLVHTGQHYDFLMSEVFFKNLSIPHPDIYLNVGSASHAVQTARVMVALEKVLLKDSPDLVIVVGDVNSTLAASLTAAKLRIKVAHVEAGLRSFDRDMPEEINRIVADSLSDYLFVTEESGVTNLKREGIDRDKIFLVGNTMIDTMLANMQIIHKSDILRRLKLTETYGVMTLHRPSNVDSSESLFKIYGILKAVTRKVKIVYSVHPRAKKMMHKFRLLNKFNSLKNLSMIEPLGYVDFIKLLKSSRFVLTDSGGIQEEAAVLNLPCLTLRENTERPVTIKAGTNYLTGANAKKIESRVSNILRGKFKKAKTMRFWDSKAAERIVNILAQRIR